MSRGNGRSGKIEEPQRYDVSVGRRNGGKVIPMKTPRVFSLTVRISRYIGLYMYLFSDVVGPEKRNGPLISPPNELSRMFI